MNVLRSKLYKALRWSERYTKTDMVYLFQGGFWLGVGQFFSSGSAFLLAIAFANLLPKETYGTYRYVLSIFSILLITTLTSMDSAVTQAVARGYSGVFRPAFKEKVRWGTLGTVVSFALGIYYYLNANAELAICFAAIALFIPFIESLDMYNAILQGKQAFKEFTLYNSSTQIIAAASSIIALLLTKNVVILVLVYVAASTALNLFFLLMTLRRHPIESTDPTVNARTITYGKHLTVINIFGTFANELDKVLVFHFLGSIDLAIYIFANAPIDQIKGLFKNIPFLAFPKLAVQKLGEVRTSIIRKSVVMSLGTAAVVLVYILATPFLFHIFFPRYIDSVIYSQVLALSILFVSPSNLLSIFMESQALKRELYRYNFFYNITSVVTLLPLVYFFGIWGAIGSRLIARSLTYFYAIYLINHAQDF